MGGGEPEIDAPWKFLSYIFSTSAIFAHSEIAYESSRLTTGFGRKREQTCTACSLEALPLIGLFL